jgi:hypothetical protein
MLTQDPDHVYEGRQAVIKELYENFYHYPKTARQIPHA